MALTKLKASNLGTSSITVEKISGSVGANARYFTANTFFLANSSWSSIANTTVRKDETIYFVIKGKNFNANTKIYVDGVATTNTIVGTNEIRCSISNTSNQIFNLAFSKKYDIEVSNSQGYNLIFKDKLETQTVPVTAHAYIIGGTTAPTPGNYTKIIFANDTATSPASTNLNVAYSLGGGSTNNANYAWYYSLNSYCNRISFSTDTQSTQTNLPGTSAGSSCAAGTFNFSYVLSSPVGSCYLFDYANNTSSSFPFTTTYADGAFSGNFDHAYKSGGGPNPGISNVDRLEYASKTNFLQNRSYLTTASFWTGSTSNIDYTWIEHGYTAASTTNESRTNRIDHSNDNVTASLRGNLATVGGYGLGIVSTDQYIYHNGGYGDRSNVSRHDMSNDTVTATLKGYLNVGRYYHTGTGGYPG